MATVQQWVAGDTIATALSTELNSLANGSATAASTAIDNETGLYQYLNLELVLASLTPTGAPTVSVYITYSTDNGTSFDDVSSAEAELLAVLPLSTTASTKRVSRGAIPIRPLQFKLFAVNNSGVALAASANTVRYRRNNEQAV